MAILGYEARDPNLRISRELSLDLRIPSSEFVMTKL